MALMCGGVRHRELPVILPPGPGNKSLFHEQKAHHNLKRDLKPNWVPSLAALPLAA